MLDFHNFNFASLKRCFNKMSKTHNKKKHNNKLNTYKMHLHQIYVFPHKIKYRNAKVTKTHNKHTKYNFLSMTLFAFCFFNSQPFFLLCPKKHEHTVFASISRTKQKEYVGGWHIRLKKKSKQTCEKQKKQKRPK